MQEKIFKAFNGFIFLFVLLALIGVTIYLGLIEMHPWMLFCIFLIFFMLPGFFLVYPNSSKVLTLFGKYSGTVKEDGFWWALPFYKKRHLSLRTRNFDSERVKVNDKRGNPILISVIFVFQELKKLNFVIMSYDSQLFTFISVNTLK